MTRLRTFDVVANTARFDAEWYAERFPDAARLGMDPREHWERFGFALSRGLSADRPVLDPGSDLARALNRRPTVSYCLAVMNRGDDIRGTLGFNLEANRPFEAELEFVLVFLDEDRATQDWVRATFADDLRSGYLRLIVEPPLDLWHFGRAKNRHRRYLVGEVFSSIDGDNFVTREETGQLLDIQRRFPAGFVFHHFSGDWGDGSSGRVSLPARLYERVGYDERFLPRQYDEMDFILSVLSRHPDLPLIRRASAQGLLGARRTQDFMRRAGLDPQGIEVPAVPRRPPLNPKGADYVGRDPALAAMQEFNQALCYVKNAPDAEARAHYLDLAIKGRHRLAEALPAASAVPLLFEPEPGRSVPQVSPQEVCAFLCVKDESAVLSRFLDHHRALGVSRFFVVDDGSAIPVRDEGHGPDVHVFRPRAGSFLTAKGLWLEALMKGHLAQGQWALTLDADEFLDLPQGVRDLPTLLTQAARRRAEFLPGLLIDTVPRPGIDPEDLARADDDFLSVLDHFVHVDGPVARDYANHPSVRWGFGPWAQLSWRVDARFHAFGTFDSLRKIPAFRFRHGRHVNQGFHSLHYRDGTPSPGWDIWATDTVLPIRHYKLRKLFSTTGRARMAAQVAAEDASQYHARTSANIRRIFGDNREGALRALLDLPARPCARIHDALRPPGVPLARADSAGWPSAATD